MDANEFYSLARIVRATGNFNYAIYQYLCGLDLEPDDVEAHRELRETALERTATGGKPLGLFERMKVARVLREPGGDEKAKMLAAEHLLAYEPGNRAHMELLLQHARAGGFMATAMWIATVIRRHRGLP
jgi:hypothetical protein